MTVSDQERLQQMDFEAMSAEDIAEAKREIRRLVLPLDLRRTRRRGPTSRADLRPAAHHPRQPAPGRRNHDHRPRRRTTRPPPLVVLCDISGSMAKYAQILMHFLHAVTNDRDRVSVFLFGTRLSNVTRQLRARDPEVAFQMVAHAVPDWSGGTRIGEALAELQPHMGQARARPGRGRAADHRRAGPRRRAWPGGEHGPAAQILPPADLAQSAVALERLRTKISGHPRDAAARGRVPSRAQPGQPARADRSVVPPGAPTAGRLKGCRMNPTEVEDVLTTAAAWRAAGEQVAVATVTETWGSSPRPAGSQMAVTKSGRMAGSVSGGCIEGAVADAAMKTIDSGTPQLLDFGVSHERAWEVGLACGGKVKVFVEKLT